MTNKKIKGSVNGDAALVGCGCWILYVLVGATIGAVAFDYSLFCFTGKGVNAFWDVLGGAVLGGITIPLAVICYILKLAGVHTPFFP